MTAASARHVALLRAINVGGKRLLPMARLAALFADAGCEDVRTYVQSGNVVYRASAPIARAVPARVEAAIARDFGFESPVITRTAAELRAIAARHVLAMADDPPTALHVGFLAGIPAGTSVIDPARAPSETFRLVGRDLYLRAPAGIGASKLTVAYLDRALGTVTTFRNWRTVSALAAMLADDA